MKVEKGNNEQVAFQMYIVWYDTQSWNIKFKIKFKQNIKSAVPSILYNTQPTSVQYFTKCIVLF